MVKTLIPPQHWKQRRHFSPIVFTKLPGCFRLQISRRKIVPGSTPWLTWENFWEKADCFQMDIISVELVQYVPNSNATILLLLFCPCHALCSSEETGDIWAMTSRMKIWVSQLLNPSRRPKVLCKWNCYFKSPGQQLCLRAVIWLVLTRHGWAGWPALGFVTSFFFLWSLLSSETKKLQVLSLYTLIYTYITYIYICN